MPGWRKRGVTVKIGKIKLSSPRKESKKRLVLSSVKTQKVFDVEHVQEDTGNRRRKGDQESQEAKGSRKKGMMNAWHQWFVLTPRREQQERKGDHGWKKIEIKGKQKK